MKLVEILARELEKWPEDGGPVASIVQDPDGFAYVRCNDDSDEFSFSQGEWIGVWSNPKTRKLHIDLSEDHATAIVTREMWQAERERIAKPAKKANAEGWIRHRGGKCPVEAGFSVEYRMRDGEIMTQPAGSLEWDHFGECGDIMAYRIHKPEEQPETVSEEVMQAGIDAADAGKLTPIADVKARFTTGGPLQWRDRIHEIDRTVEALEEERVSLIQRLEGEGFRLIERINELLTDAAQAHEDMSDWRNWKVGDIVEIIESGGWANKKGERHAISQIDGSEMPILANGIWYRAEMLAYHSRPSA